MRAAPGRHRAFFVLRLLLLPACGMTGVYFRLILFAVAIARAFLLSGFPRPEGCPEVGQTVSQQQVWQFALPEFWLLKTMCANATHMIRMLLEGHY